MPDKQDGFPNKKIPLRTCIGCRSKKPKKEMIRIVHTPEGTLEMDVTGKKNGRGAYICKDSKCFETLKKSKGLDRSFKSQVSVDVYDRLIEELQSL